MKSVSLHSPCSCLRYYMTSSAQPSSPKKLLCDGGFGHSSLSPHSQMRVKVTCVEILEYLLVCCAAKLWYPMSGGFT
ncbi:hypothetical protein Pmani_002691 [Petrolisthes manimaculis]|uniref:Uncharacterized protein n=1 Tax=Petrolisthes manimaculis TaxID=1843537 RepID=A0AAE1UN89_9EUCA|nr:hypothetical protein Pmani_002691 [Petrolisthes manimaculis]